MAQDTYKILIVDDVENNRFILRDIIQEMGYMPILAANGIQALKVLEKISPHLILLDIAMPEMDGYEFCQIVKKDPEKREIPVIFISAFDDPADIVKGFTMGGEDYITKPFIPEVVKARVGLHLKIYETGREWQEANRLLQSSVNEQLKQIEAEKKNVLHALTRVAKECVAYDEERMQRICYNCRVLAEAMQLSVEYGSLISDMFIDTIGLSAPLCNLGNLALPTELLQKTGDLTSEEEELLQSHTKVGAEIIKDIQEVGDYNDFCQIAAEIAENHHENWDGTGYPAGKKGDEIPLSAQIVSAVCGFCAATEDCMQDRAQYGEAIHTMERDAGKKYNPVIFEILQKVYRQFH